MPKLKGDMGNNRKRLSHAERLDWLRLYRSENVGPVTFFRLIEQFGSAGGALDALPALARRGGRKKPITICSKAEAEREMDRIEATGGVMIASIEPDFPASLHGLDTAPLLIALGNPHLLSRPAIAIVGARNASAAGRRMAELLTRDLGASGLLIVSGLARGIDTAAHEAALPTGTVAVMAGGVDVVYPPENIGLYRRIRDEGCILSEMPPGTQPQAAHFPRRNRLISGCALGVVVIEATLRSGSLITARFALEQGRDVFAVPGSPLDSRSQGPNGLIRQGAILTENADDVLGAIQEQGQRLLTEPDPYDFRPSPAPIPDERTLAISREKLLQSLGPTPVTVDEIIRQCQLSPSIVSLNLLELELAGRIERHPGHRVSLIY